MFALTLLSESVAVLARPASQRVRRPRSCSLIWPVVRFCSVCVLWGDRCAGAAVSLREHVAVDPFDELGDVAPVEIPFDEPSSLAPSLKSSGPV